MFLLDSLMISGLKWVMQTVVTSAEAEMNDDTALREQLLDAEMRREMGEITDDEFAAIETDVFERIREIKARTQPQDVIVDEEHRVAGVEITVDDDV